MTDIDRSLARRDLIKGASLGLGAGLVSNLVRPAEAQTAPAVATNAEIWSGEYWAQKGAVKLAMYRKRASAPKPGEPPLPVIFLVHGSSNSARTSFDLSTPGRGEYSMMNAFARFGFDVWTLDHENYGRSSRTESNSDIASGAQDLAAGSEVVIRETGQSRLHFCGASSGAIRAGAFAMVKPERVDRLVLIALTYKGGGSPTLARRAERLEYYRTHNRRLRDREMIRSIFTRDGAGRYDMAVVDVLADEELKFGDQVPTGTYLDMTANLPLVDPKKVLAPTLLIRGEHDGIASVADLIDFYTQLPNGDRQFAILPDVAHNLIFAANRHMAFHAIRAFLTMPARAAA
jgi:alpha-beta hydrolase superfamily lysophospholipase